MREPLVDRADGLRRCEWWETADPLLLVYHDEEWGLPCHDDRDLFERLMLEGFQAGLSWLTILRKREHFRRAFDGWDAERISAYGPEDVGRLLGDAGIVRHGMKIQAAIRNARQFLEIQQQMGSFDSYIWTFVGGATLQTPAPRGPQDVPARTPESDALSKDLKRRGFGFVGSTICYAFMQSVGMVNDHIAGCFRATPPDLPARR